jgi:SAM-dependent methyltransferase
MAQDTSGWRALLGHGWAYDVAQKAMGGSRTRRWMQREFIRAMPGERVLDIGCGTADILTVLPDVDYVGFDISEPYIARARARWRLRGQFHAQYLDRATLESLGKFDLILATGVLHHLEDEEVGALFEMLADGLRPTARIITVDGCHVRGQNPFARFLINHDRGRNVRTPDAYATLARRSLADVRGWVIHRTWIPYTYWIMRAGHTAMTDDDVNSSS